MKIPSFSQDYIYSDEGFACLDLIARYYDENHSMLRLREMAETETGNKPLLAISGAAEKIGFRVRWVNLTYKQVVKELRFPCILHWGPGRFIVLIPHSKWKTRKELRCADPRNGLVNYDEDVVLANWAEVANEKGERRGAVMIMEPTLKFFNKCKDTKDKLSWGKMAHYFRHNHLQIAGVVFTFLTISFAQLIFPFLVQSIVDIGVNTQDVQYLTMVLAAQIMMVIGRIVVEFIRAHLLLQISTSVNLAILSDFWIKLARLPISYFDRFHTGGILQRMNDNKRMQSFFTGPVLNTFFSMFNFIVFAIVLMLYKAELFLIFGVGVSFYFIWMRLFFGIRRKLNYQVFHASARETNSALQMVQGMEEIRLQNIEQPKRWEWESVQVDIFRLSTRNLAYGQLQSSGALFLIHVKDIILSFVVAKYVIQGQLTFGAMLAVQYIIGQLAGPIEQFIGFIQSAQDAKITLDRLNEIHQMDDEENELDNNFMRKLPLDKTIRLENLTFKYPGQDNKPVLNNIELEIPEGKTTAIVGASGSGKTTLLRLLLKYYNTYEGNIMIGDTDFKKISPSFWRNQCAAVMQDGFIFNDTIANNISLEYGKTDYYRLINACKMANILSFIDSLPHGFDTRLGVEGVGVSQGQKQRLLIARAAYKDPHYLFFDESTNALDAKNERIIVENMQEFFKNRTVIVVAHRLSTVKNADKIVMLDQGCIIEEGSHRRLSQLKGKYFELVKNQLDLGN